MAPRASLKIGFCLFLVLLIFSNSESRPPPAPLLSKMSKQQALMQIKVLKASIARQAAAAAAGSGFTDSKRVSPGGPDGHHH
ncbi:hypothetical protein CerSpe_153730 [Prunus speciosa]